MGRRKQSKQQEQQMNTKLSLSQVTKWLGWFWDLERIWSLECVLDWMLLLLYWIGTSENLDAIEGGGWGVFIASNHFLAVGWVWWRWAHQIVWWCTGQVMFTVWCVPHQHARWGVERLDCWNPLSCSCTGQSDATPDMSGVLWLLCSDLCRALFTIVHFRQMTVGAGYRCSIGSPDMSGAHQTVQWIIAERALKKPKSGLFAWYTIWCATW
jgi:hypothetical protein